jgi:hypothetical protein
MKREFCTLIDSNYAIEAIATHRSLVACCPNFHLTALCLDDEAKGLIDRLALPHMSTVGLSELEAYDPELFAVKRDRSPVEYRWTSTPALQLYVCGNRPEVQEVTYLDADLLFFSDPEPLFEEMGDRSLITPHRYAEEYRHQEINGVYNVQKYLDDWPERFDGVHVLDHKGGGLAPGISRATRSGRMER